MLIESYPDTKEVLIECDNCKRKYIIENYEIELQPYPHFTCPNCGEWIAVF